MQEDDDDETSIPNSFISPPWLTNIISNQELTSAKDILHAAIEYLRHFIIHDHVEGKMIIQTLFSWATDPMPPLLVSQSP